MPAMRAASRMGVPTGTVTSCPLIVPVTSFWSRRTVVTIVCRSLFLESLPPSGGVAIRLPRNRVYHAEFGQKMPRLNRCRLARVVEFGARNSQLDVPGRVQFDRSYGNRLPCG